MVEDFLEVGVIDEMPAARTFRVPPARRLRVALGELFHAHSRPR